MREEEGTFISLSSGLYPKTSRYVLLRRFFQQAFSGARAPSPLYHLLGLRFPFRPGTLAVFRKCPVAAHWSAEGGGHVDFVEFWPVPKDLAVCSTAQVLSTGL